MAGAISQGVAAEFASVFETAKNGGNGQCATKLTWSILQILQGMRRISDNMRRMLGDFVIFIFWHHPLIQNKMVTG